MAYLTLAELKSRSAFEPKEWDAFLASRDAQLGEAVGTLRTFIDWGLEIDSEIDDALRRRYIVPFVLPPQTVKKWAAKLWDERLYEARRYPGSDAPVDSDLAAAAGRARQAMTDAANPDNPPAPELPLRADLPGSSGVTKGGPFIITFQSGFDVFDELARRRVW